MENAGLENMVLENTGTENALDLFKFWEIMDNISEMVQVQDRDIVSICGASFGHFAFAGRLV